MKKNYRFEHLLFVGIDPGVNTGYSVLEYHTETKEFKVL
jgi:predicted RNase H-like nuclease (RuvC/YqgF family)